MRSAADVKVGDRLRIRVREARLDVDVVSIEPIDGSRNPDGASPARPGRAPHEARGGSPSIGDSPIVGDPIGHSKSPIMHAAAFRALGLPHTYEAVRVPADAVPEIVARLRRGEFDGLNVTVPHKERVLSLVDALDERARVAGAANTLVRAADGRVIAHNTDAPALAAELSRLAGACAWPAGARALVLGSGGAARAAIAALGAHLGVREIAVRARAFADRRDATLSCRRRRARSSPSRGPLRWRTRRGPSRSCRRRARACAAQTTALSWRTWSRGTRSNAPPSPSTSSTRPREHALARGRATPRPPVRQRPRDARAAGGPGARALARRRRGEGPFSKPCAPRSNNRRILETRGQEPAAPRVPAHRSAPRLPGHRADGAHPARRRRAHVHREHVQPPLRGAHGQLRARRGHRRRARPRVPAARGQPERAAGGLRLEGEPRAPDAADEHPPLRRDDGEQAHRSGDDRQVPRRPRSRDRPPRDGHRAPARLGTHGGRTQALRAAPRDGRQPRREHARGVRAAPRSAPRARLLRGGRARPASHLRGSWARWSTRSGTC